jgi:hypothetical protein
MKEQEIPSISCLERREVAVTAVLAYKEMEGGANITMTKWWYLLCASCIRYNKDLFFI